MRYTDLWGYDMELLWALQERLNFTYETFSDATYDWGKISDDEGVWLGMAGQAESGFTDMIFGGYAFSDQYGMVLQPKLFPQRDFLGFASPPPRPRDKFFTLLTPYDVFTWITIAASIFVCGLIIFFTMRTEEAITSKTHRTEHTDEGTGLLRSVWICFATMIRESLPKKQLLEKRYALRY